MSKYSLKTNIKAVHEVFKLGMSSGAVAKSLSTANAVIQRWFACYEELETNLLERNFKADKPNQKWIIDITEFALFEKKL